MIISCLLSTSMKLKILHQTKPNFELRAHIFTDILATICAQVNSIFNTSRVGCLTLLSLLNIYAFQGKFLHFNKNKCYLPFDVASLWKMKYTGVCKTIYTNSKVSESADLVSGRGGGRILQLESKVFNRFFFIKTKYAIFLPICMVGLNMRTKKPCDK